MEFQQQEQHHEPRQQQQRQQHTCGMLRADRLLPSPLTSSGGLRRVVKRRVLRHGERFHSNKGESVRLCITCMLLLPCRQ
jgi:hypothetical protein